MADKYIALIAGVLTEVEGTVSSAGAGDAGKVVALDAGGLLDPSVLPVGVGPATVTLVTSENLAAGDYVNIYDNAGTATARKADANGKPAHGFTLAGVTSPANVTMYKDGVNNQVTGLDPGVRHYLSETAGLATDTPPTTSGAIVQYLGMTISATELLTNIEDGVVLA